MTLTQEYVDGVIEGRAWLHQHGPDDASVESAILDGFGPGVWFTREEAQKLRALKRPAEHRPLVSMTGSKP